MLLRKLQHHGFGGKLLEWFKSYISNRSQRVTALRATSQLLPVTSGVPQGSILGPVLFLLYVNSLPDSIITSKTATFADDTKIYKPIMSLCDSHLLQDDLSRLVSWSDSVGLIFNSSKCKAQRITRKLKPITYDYTMDRTTLEFTESEKDLGVIVTADLTWSKQVCNQCSKANKMLGFVRRNLRFVKSIPVRRCMYLALVRSHLCYATQVWSPQSKDLLRQLERVQRRATKFILDLPFICNYTYRDRLIKLDLLPITYFHEYFSGHDLFL